jgi:hypothetical protein
MSSHANVEHIFLTSDFEDDTPRERAVDLEFEQSSRLPRCEMRFTIFNRHYIEVESISDGRKTRHFDIDLAFLDPRPRRVRRIDWQSIRIAAVLLVLAGLAFVLPGLVSVWGLGALLLAGSLAALGLAVYRSRDRVVFYSRYGRAPLVMLLSRKPSAKAIDAFVSDVSQRVESAHREWPDLSVYLSAELKQHRRLKENGSLTETAYQRVKQRILEHHR